jgi:hypothetical protein
MHEDLSINRAAVDRMLGHVRPLSSLCREVGLAAVAAELHLSIDDLELDAADAVERGAAVLFLAGFGPKVAAPVSHRRKGKSRGSEMRRSASVRRSRRLHTGKATAPAVDGVSRSIGSENTSVRRDRREESVNGQPSSRGFRDEPE